MRVSATCPDRFAGPATGLTLVECLVYMTVVGILFGVGSIALYRCWDDNKAITRNADDIVRTLKAGEAWRADVRSATGPIQITTNNSEQTILIPCGTNVLSYVFANGEVQKQTGKISSRIVVLSKLKSSRMASDSRDHAMAWRWEVELEPGRQNVQMHPLFTFEAVAGNYSEQ